MNKFRALFAAFALVLTLGATVAAAARSAGSPVQHAHQQTVATPHAAAGTTSPNEDSHPTAGTHPMNHGLFVSKAAHTCGHGAHAVHGKCVRAVAHSAQGK